MASSLSIWQKSELTEAIEHLNLCNSRLYRILDYDAVDDIEDAETLASERKNIETAIRNLSNLL